MTLNERWKQLDQRFVRLAKREKLLVSAAVLVGTVFLGNVLFVEPQLKAVKSARSGVEKATAEIATLSGELSGLKDQLKRDPNAIARTELAALRARINEIGSEIESQQSVLVPPDRMNQLLETLLQRHPALRLVSLKSLPPTSMLPPLQSSGESRPAAREFDLYRHGVEVRIEGTYADLYAYLLSLERHEQKLLWSEVRLAVEEYPRAQLLVVVHTLSADRAWLKI